MKTKKISTYDLVVVGVMAALIFAATSFLKVEIPTPAGPCMIKIANVLCLLGGMLFGGWRGGLAAGIGSMFFDLTNPLFTASAPFTLVFFFLMVMVCGTISHGGGKNGSSMRRNIVAAIAGSLTYYVLYISKSILVMVLSGSDFQAALAANSMKMITSLFNMAVAIPLSVLLLAACRSALIRAGLANRLFPPKDKLPKVADT